MAKRYSPTRFERRFDQTAAAITKHNWALSLDTHDSRHVLDHRDQWRRLGGGIEGEVFRLNGTVIKTFNIRRSPLRNCVPGASRETRWPSEIPASLLLGGMRDDLHDEDDFLPVKDYFLTSPTDHSKASWHFVMPYLEGGSLLHLADRLRTLGLTYRELDAMFRPSLNRLLAALDKMHNDYQLCHDDIKPENVFVATFAKDGSTHTDTHWLLGDLGNVRSWVNQYHASRLWQRESGQHADCRINDAIRLVKTYVLFLRVSVADTAPFDAAFWAGGEPWSHLYWWATKGYVPGSIAASSLRDKSLEVAPRAVDEYREQEHGIWSFSCLLNSACIQTATKRELMTRMVVKESRARFLGLTGIFGLPSTSC
ncbi:uncharacterized protein B0I36DRAFT_371657 [Microdochium trichocladiopsis]|uniref:Protein kinase domain-containing protein n=1 Tax=Microdochium trichocladiopsis TaxID=1682393 RepID=A0A9P8YL04_9PEZI|nr:uncharacterized protein B0I36DRAFT_371657 [Microdochium trichocladiopsis]KAH7041461.1 hypothetical protein B0I36DRAFT_371657 [Microdochium trichocladiopsis]